ncbi:MFS transporter [Desulfosporosinus fructosivorans]
MKSIKEEHRGKVLGIISSGTAYGLILNGALIPYILTHYNWQTVWLVFGMLSLIIGLFGIYVTYTTLDASLTQNNESEKPKIREESTGAFSRDSFLKSSGV